MYHLETPKNDVSSPIMFDLKSEGGESWIYDDNYQVNTVYFALGDESDFDKTPCSLDKTGRWLQDVKVVRYVIKEAELEKVEKFPICTVSEGSSRTLIVLDSGADISLLPQPMAGCGRPSGSGRAVLEDAQGGRLMTYGKKLAQIECDGDREVVIIEDDFVVASVQCPLISLGRLLQRGWKLTPGSGEAGVHLQAPDGACSVPLHFKRNSLALYGTTSRVCQEPGELCGGGNSKSLDDDEVLVVRVVLKLNDDFWTHYGLRAWRTTKDGNPMKFCYETKNFVDGQLMWNLNWWPLRSTLIRKMDDTWELVEHCNSYYTQEEPDAEIPECCGMDTQTLTILHRKKEPISFFGSVIGEQTVTAGGAQVDSNDFQFSSEPNVPFELQEEQEVTAEEIEQRDGEGDPWNGPILMFENKESLVVNNTELSERSPLRALREAAEFLGVGRGGSKNALWTRINQEVQEMEHKELFTTANRLFREQNQHKGLVPVHVPRQPSAEERELHELTHIPFQDWCDFCLACKSRVDPQRPLDGSDAGRRSVPGIQLDYTFGKSRPEEVNKNVELVTVLTGVDCETRMLLCVPVEGKGSDLRGQAEHVVRFSLSLNHYGNVEVVGDSEPTMKALLSYVKTLRHGLGLETTITFSMKKGQTGRVERAIQTLRRQASTLMEMLQDKCKLNLPSEHALWQWAYLHAAWLLNRFGAHRAIQAAPFELWTQIHWQSCLLW